MKIAFYLSVIAVLLAAVPARGQTNELPQDHLTILLERASSGDIRAQRTLGSYFYNGEDDKKPDYKKAVLWYRRAAEQGDTRAQIALGLCYYHGRGVPRDYWQAFRLMLWPNGGLEKKSCKNYSGR